jgi:hypothetical protein
MLKIHEVTRTDGTLSPVHLALTEGPDGGLALHTEEGVSPLPQGALEAVIARFGGPLEPSEKLGHVAALDLGEGRTLRHVRHRARYDVIARDYLVLEQPHRDPICALATTVAGALDHLARAARQ